MEEKDFFLNDVESVNKTGFKKGDKVKTVEKVGSGEVGTVACVIGPLLEAKTFNVKYKVMVKFPEKGEFAFNPEDLKKA